MAKQRADLLIYRLNPALEVMLVHPGGPYFQNRDEGHWSIPKGEIEPGEDPLQCAIREIKEEIGLTPSPPFFDLGLIKQKGGKIVMAWACQISNDFDLVSTFSSQKFTMEWPPRSGIYKEFPEVDNAAFFTTEEASRKILASQKPFLLRLEVVL